MSFLEFCDEMEARELDAEARETSEDDAYELREQEIADGDAPDSCPENCGGVVVYQEDYDGGGARYHCLKCDYYEDAE